MRNCKGLWQRFGLPRAKIRAPRNVPVELRSDRDSRGIRLYVSVAEYPDNMGKTFPNRPQHFRKNGIRGGRQLL